MAKKRITKEELEKLLAYRAELIKKKGRYFSKVCPECRKEYDEFKPCERCKFIGKDCHRTCGIIMKWEDIIRRNNSDGVSFGNNGHVRITTEKEFYDTTAVNPGISEEVDQFIKDEMNGAALAEASEIPMSSLSDYDLASLDDYDSSEMVEVDDD